MLPDSPIIDMADVEPEPDDCLPVAPAPLANRDLDLIAIEVERLAAEEAELSAPKQRQGGPHPDILPGEVGPCTRCGWIWTPSARTISTYVYPLRCANCRSDYWYMPPVRDFARHPADPEWATRRDTIANRKHRRKVDKIVALAKELNVDVINVEACHPPKRSRRKPRPHAEPDLKPVIDMTPRLPWQRPPHQAVHAIPPPPGLEEEG